MVRSRSVFTFVLSKSFLTRIGAGRVAEQFPQDVGLNVQWGCRALSRAFGFLP